MYAINPPKAFMKIVSYKSNMTQRAVKRQDNGHKINLNK